MVFVGVDIGGTNLDIALLDSEFCSLESYPTKSKLPEFYNLLEELIKSYKPKAVGIGAAMWFKDNKPIKAPNLPQVIEVRDQFLKTPLFWDNDANCFALYCSIEFGIKNLFGITIGTGIGCGIVLDGKVVRGRGIACEIGHTFVGGRKKCVCGGYGHLECYFSGWSLKNPEKLVENGEIYSIRGFKMLCKAIANAVMLLDPEVIAIGGRIGGKLDEGEIKSGLQAFLMQHFEPEVKIVNDPLAVAKGACLFAKLSFQSL